MMGQKDVDVVDLCPNRIGDFGDQPRDKSPNELGSLVTAWPCGAQM